MTELIHDVAAADLDGDHCPDLLWGRPATGGGPGSVWVQLATGPAAFAPPTSFLAADVLSTISVADVDADGRVDVLAAGNTGCVSLLRNAGGGALAPALGFPGGLASFDAKAADVDADGRPDVVAVDLGADSVVVLRNQLAAPAGTSPFGLGTPGCAGALALGAATAPKVGAAAFAFTCTQAPPSALGLCLVANQPDVAGADPFGLGVALHVDLLAATFLEALAFASDPGGSGTAPAPIPSLPGLAGVTLHAQGIWLEKPPFVCTASPAGLVSSRGLTITIAP